jgi:hypothetical protein
MFVGSPNLPPNAPESANSVPSPVRFVAAGFLVSWPIFRFGILLWLTIVCSAQQVKSRAVECV